VRLLRNLLRRRNPTLGWVRDPSRAIELDLGSSSLSGVPLGAPMQSIQPDGRPTFDEVYLELAFMLARRSTCRRLNVGTVITTTDHRRVLAVGYNGGASGLHNDCDRPDPGNCGCLHAEENACINCDSPRALEKQVFVTHLPCPMCAKRLINLGSVTRVTFGQSYRSQEGRNLLESAGITVVQASLDRTTAA